MRGTMMEMKHRTRIVRFVMNGCKQNRKKNSKSYLRYNTVQYVRTNVQLVVNIADTENG